MTQCLFVFFFPRPFFISRNETLNGWIQACWCSSQIKRMNFPYPTALHFCQMLIASAKLTE